MLRALLLCITLILFAVKVSAQAHWVFYFPTAGIAASDSSQRHLQAIRAFIQNNKNAFFYVEGFTDSTANDSVNIPLSQKRANGLAASLVALGIPRANIQVSYWGEQLPAAANATPAGRALNRRVEVYADTVRPVQGKDIYWLRYRMYNSSDNIYEAGHITIRDANDHVIYAFQSTRQPLIICVPLRKDQEYTLLSIPLHCQAFQNTLDYKRLSYGSSGDTIDFTISTPKDLKNISVQRLFTGVNIQDGVAGLNENTREQIRKMLKQSGMGSQFVLELVEVNPTGYMGKAKAILLKDIVVQATSITDQFHDDVFNMHQSLYPSGQLLNYPGAASRVYIRLYQKVYQ